MARAMGLDVGTHACKVAVVDGSGRSARLVRFAEVPYEAGEGGIPTRETIAAGIRKAVSDARGPRHAASHALPAEQCILREIGVPFDQDEQIRKTVKFEFEPHLHSGAIEDVQLMMAVGLRVANAEKYPEWKPGNEFKARRDEMVNK